MTDMREDEPGLIEVAQQRYTAAVQAATLAHAHAEVMSLLRGKGAISRGRVAAVAERLRVQSDMLTTVAGGVVLPDGGEVV